MLCAGAMQFEDWNACDAVGSKRLGAFSAAWSGAYRLFERERIDKQALFGAVRNAVLESLEPEKPKDSLCYGICFRRICGGGR